MPANVEIELIADYQCVVGENPLWHQAEKRLYWLDIPDGRIFRYDPATGKHEMCRKGGVIGGFTVQADGGLLLFGADGRIETWKDGRTSTIVREIPQERGARFNDVIADPAGRVFCGTLRGGGVGRLYRLDLDGTLTVVQDDVQCSNGLGFTPDLKGMYYTDSPKLEIYLYNYDRAAGGISNRRVFVRTPAGGGVPDGLTVDSEGYIWSARWDGGCVVRHAPDGSVDRRIDLPARKVSSVVFGGEDYGDLYVTTAGGDKKAADGAAAGSLFRLRPGVRGVPEFLSRIGLP